MATFFDAGRYRAEITGQALGETKTGKPQLVLTFRIVGRVDPGNPDGPTLAAPDGERRVYLVLTENTVEIVGEALARIGFAGRSFGELDPTEPPYQDFRGQEHTLYCSHETYQNEPRERWGFAREGAVITPLGADRVARLDQQYGSRLLPGTGIPTERPQEAVSQGRLAGVPAGPPRDEIPF